MLLRHAVGSDMHNRQTAPKIPEGCEELRQDHREEEEAQLASLKTRVELSTAIFDWIEVFYNRQRRHSALGNIAPIEFERRRQQQPKAA